MASMGAALLEKMQHAKEGVKETLKKASHPTNRQHKADDHAQAEAAKAQASERRQERNKQQFSEGRDPRQEMGHAGSYSPTVGGKNINTTQGDPSARDPATSPELAAKTYQPSSLDNREGGVKGALKKAVNKLTPGDGVAGPNAALAQGMGPNSSVGLVGFSSIA